MEDVAVHPRVHKQHPELLDEDVLCAWINCIRAKPRIDKANEYIAIGSDNSGRLIEMVAVTTIEGFWLVYHAATPPTKKMLRELRFIDGRNK